MCAFFIQSSKPVSDSCQFKKVEDMKMQKRNRKMTGFGMPNPLKVWNCHRFHAFRNSRKSRKIDARMDPKSHGKSQKMEPRAAKCPLIVHF